MTWHKSEEEVDKIIEDVIARTKGKYLTQGVSFNKTCPRQMELLKKALMSSASFSGLAKEALAMRLQPNLVIGQMGQGMSGGFTPPVPMPEQNKKKNIGNFI